MIMVRPPLNKDTRLCISLAARPSNIGTRFHNYLYDQLGLDFIYKAFTTTDIAAAIGGVRALGIRGCSVSMPFKEDVLRLVDEIEQSARRSSRSTPSSTTTGASPLPTPTTSPCSDCIAEHRLDRAQSVLIHGSGGMAKAVGIRIPRQRLPRRDGRRAQRRDRPGVGRATGLRLARPHLGGATATLIVNVTPIGMAGGPEAAEPRFATTTLAGADTVFDVVALPPETPLIAPPRDAGKHVITGAEVIALQAAEQFERYTGVRPTPEQVAEASAFSRA